MSLLYAALFGLIGGIARALIGILKHYRIKSKNQFKPSYFTITIFISAFIGMFTSLLLTSNYALSLIAGYAGIDIIENLVKIYNKKLSL